ncbi:MAG: hypothetical protein AAF352_06825, partial [Pseudomonadota bacterium]
LFLYGRIIILPLGILTALGIAAQYYMQLPLDIAMNAPFWFGILGYGIMLWLWAQITMMRWLSRSLR